MLLNENLMFKELEAKEEMSYILLADKDETTSL